MIRVGYPVENLYSLSKCDFLVGPPSSYIGWSAFYGNKPLLTIEDYDNFMQKNIKKRIKSNFMLRVFFLKKLLSVLGYNLVNTKLSEDSDDPFLVISRIFKCESIRTIIDGGASIGETSLRFLTLFPESKVYMFEPYSGFKQYLEEKESLYSNLIYEPCALSNCQSYKLLQINESKGTNSILHGDSIGKEIYEANLKMWEKKK